MLPAVTFVPLSTSPDESASSDSSAHQHNHDLIQSPSPPVATKRRSPRVAVINNDFHPVVEEQVNGASTPAASSGDTLEELSQSMGSDDDDQIVIRLLQ